jgi:hypothetical protein
VGKHTSPNGRLAHPQIKYLRLGDIEGVHPAVLKKLKQKAPEPLVGLRSVKEEAIQGAFAVPHIAVVPASDRERYWVWIGVRSYQRLLDIEWQEEFPVLNYGQQLTEKRIVDLACADRRFGYIISGASAESDWATAQEWEADTEEICKPAKAGSRRRPSGLKTFASLRGLKSRSLRDDKEVKAPESSNQTGSADYGSDEERTED